MLVEERIYTLQIGAVPEYMRLYETEGLKIQLAHLVNMVGYYSTEVGDLNVIVHMWAYESFEERMKRRAALGGDANWREYIAKLKPLIVSQKNRLMHPAPFFLPRLKTMLDSVRAKS